jgi:HK97 family phage prohead protease
MQRLTKDIGTIVPQATGIGSRQIRVIASTQTPDRVGDIVVLSGLQLDNYRRNPIVLANHSPDCPIGTAQVEVKSGRLEALVTFAPAGASEEADEWCALAKSAVVRSASIGFQIQASSPLKGGGLRIESSELLEISLVTVPANPEALITQRSLALRHSGRTISAKTTTRERRNAEVSALRRKATESAAERAATVAMFRQKGVSPPSGNPSEYSADRRAELEDDARLRSNLFYAKELTLAQRLEQLERLRR